MVLEAAPLRQDGDTRTPWRTWEVHSNERSLVSSFWNKCTERMETSTETDEHQEFYFVLRALKEQRHRSWLPASMVLTITCDLEPPSRKGPKFPTYHCVWAGSLDAAWQVTESGLETDGKIDGGLARRPTEGAWFVLLDTLVDKPDSLVPFDAHWPSQRKRVFSSAAMILDHTALFRLQHPARDGYVEAIAAEEYGTYLELTRTLEKCDAHLGDIRASALELFDELNKGEKGKAMGELLGTLARHGCCDIHIDIYPMARGRDAQNFPEAGHRSAILYNAASVADFAKGYKVSITGYHHPIKSTALPPSRVDEDATCKIKRPTLVLHREGPKRSLGRTVASDYTVTADNLAVTLKYWRGLCEIPLDIEETGRPSPLSVLRKDGGEYRFGLNSKGRLESSNLFAAVAKMVIKPEPVAPPKLRGHRRPVIDRTEQTRFSPLTPRARHTLL